MTNCLVAHLLSTENEREREFVKRMINNHIADNFEVYYKDKITFPYEETIGVGDNSQTVKCLNQEEYLSFLRSDKSLYVFSNYQEILAIANLFNINIRIFVYGIDEDTSRYE